MTPLGGSSWVGQLVGRDVAGPFVLAVAARPRPGALVRAVGPDRDAAGQDVADVAVDVGVDEVLGRRAVGRERGLELLEVRGRLEVEDRLERPVDLGGRGPAEGEERRALEARVDVVEDRAVAGLPHVEDDVRAAGDLDRLGPDRERDRLLAEDVAVGVRRVRLLDEEVLDVRIGVRRAPRDPGVVAEDDAGHARERDAGDVVRAVRADRPAVEAVHEPDRRHAMPRCGSLARSAPPDLLFDGAMTQSFEPTW